MYHADIGEYIKYFHYDWPEWPRDCPRRVSKFFKPVGMKPPTSGHDGTCKNWKRCDDNKPH